MTSAGASVSLVRTRSIHTNLQNSMVRLLRFARNDIVIMKFLCIIPLRKKCCLCFDNLGEGNRNFECYRPVNTVYLQILHFNLQSKPSILKNSILHSQYQYKRINK